MSLKDIEKPIDKRLEPIKGLEITFSENMIRLSLEMLRIQHILDENELSESKRIELQKQKSEMMQEFKKELHILNPTQMALCNYFLHSKKNKSDKH